MGKKYIIEKDDNESIWSIYADKDGDATIEGVSLTPYTEPNLEQVRKEAYKDGYDAGFGRKIDASYHEGLADAWEAVKKLARMDTDTSESITGYFGLHNIMHNLTAFEVIEKLKAYEQEKEMDGLRQNIQTIVDKCGYSLDEIAEVLRKMKESDNG